MNNCLIRISKMFTLKDHASSHDPTGLSHLTQFRDGLSKLNFHKFKHNFRYTINSMCPANDGIEDIGPSFALPRRELLAGVSALLRSFGNTNGLSKDIHNSLLCP